MLNVSPLNLLFTVLNLLVLLVLMKKFLYQPVLGVIAKRKELIDSQFKQAAETKAEAEALKEQYKNNLSDAGSQRERIIKEARVEAQAEADKILEATDQKARQILEEARKVSAEEREKTMKQTESEIAKLAVLAASKIVSEASIGASTEKSNYAIYNEFLKKAGE